MAVKTECLALFAKKSMLKRQRAAGVPMMCRIPQIAAAVDLNSWWHHVQIKRWVARTKATMVILAGSTANSCHKKVATLWIMKN